MGLVSLGPSDFTSIPFTHTESTQHPRQANRETVLGDKTEARPGSSPRIDFSPALPMNKDGFFYSFPRIRRMETHHLGARFLGKQLPSKYP